MPAMIETKKNGEYNTANNQIERETNQLHLEALLRQPYIAPRVTPYKPSIEGSNTTDIPESQNGLWLS